MKSANSSDRETSANEILQFSQQNIQKEQQQITLTHQWMNQWMTPVQFDPKHQQTKLDKSNQNWIIRISESVFHCWQIIRTANQRNAAEFEIGLSIDQRLQLKWRKNVPKRKCNETHWIIQSWLKIESVQLWIDCELSMNCCQFYPVIWILKSIEFNWTWTLNCWMNQSNSIR